ncbi:MAG: hypothetical protein F6K55_44940, partial [Moorea sp. SIO4A3]|nr:hypothetical protein [Moorena sp. SIO4A3]
VLGQNGSDLTWGKPTRNEPVNLETFSLKDVKSINLLVDNQVVDLEQPPDKGRAIALEFQFLKPIDPVKVPFTEIPLAVEWGKYLQSLISSH